MLDHRPSHLRRWSAEWRDHRRRCEPEGSEHFRNEVDQNCLKVDSGGRYPFDPKAIHSKIAANSSPNRCFHHVTASRPRWGGQNSRNSID